MAAPTPPPAAAEEEDEERAPLHQTAAASLPSPDPAREGTVVRQHPRPAREGGSCATSHRVQAGSGTAQAGESLRRRLARHDLVPTPLSVYVTFLANTDAGTGKRRRDLRCRRRPESRPKSQPRARRSLSCSKGRSTRRHMALLAWRCVNHEPRHTQTFVLTDAGNGDRRSEGTAQWKQNSKLMFVQDPDSDKTRQAPQWRHEASEASDGSPGPHDPEISRALPPVG